MTKTRTTKQTTTKRAKKKSSASSSVDSTDSQPAPTTSTSSSAGTVTPVKRSSNYVKIGDILLFLRKKLNDEEFDYPEDLEVAKSTWLEEKLHEHKCTMQDVKEYFGINTKRKLEETKAKALEDIIGQSGGDVKNPDLALIKFIPTSSYLGVAAMHQESGKYKTMILFEEEAATLDIDDTEQYEFIQIDITDEVIKAKITKLALLQDSFSVRPNGELYKLRQNDKARHICAKVFILSTKTFGYEVLLQGSTKIVTVDLDNLRAHSRGLVNSWEQNNKVERERKKSRDEQQNEETKTAGDKIYKSYVETSASMKFDTDPIQLISRTMRNDITQSSQGRMLSPSSTPSTIVNDVPKSSSSETDISNEASESKGPSDGKVVNIGHVESEDDSDDATQSAPVTLQQGYQPVSRQEFEDLKKSVHLLQDHIGLYVSKSEVAPAINLYNQMKIWMTDSVQQVATNNSNIFIALTPGTVSEQQKQYNTMYRDANKNYKVFKAGDSARSSSKSPTILYSFKQYCMENNVSATHKAYTSDATTDTVMRWFVGYHIHYLVNAKTKERKPLYNVSYTTPLQDLMWNRHIKDLVFEMFKCRRDAHKKNSKKKRNMSLDDAK